MTEGPLTYKKSRSISHCYKRGKHVPMADVPVQPTQFGKRVYIGCVCEECGVVFYEYAGPASQVLDGGGNVIVQG